MMMMMMTLMLAIFIFSDAADDSLVYILWNSQQPKTLSARVGFYVGCCSRRLPFRASSHHCLIDLLLVATASLSIAACRVVFLLYHVHNRAIGSLHLRCGAPQSVHSTLQTEYVRSHLPRTFRYDPHPLSPARIYRQHRQIDNMFCMCVGRCLRTLTSIVTRLDPINVVVTVIGRLLEFQDDARLHHKRPFSSGGGSEHTQHPWLPL